MSSIANLQYFSQVDDLVAQYRYSLRKPAATLEIKKSTLNNRLTVLSDLRTKLKTLQSTIDDLSKTGSDSVFNTFNVASTNTTIAGGSATSTAIMGSHSLFVTQLAKNDSLTSNRITSSATTIIGAESAGTKTFQLTINGTATNVSINLVDGETNDSIMTKVVNAINESGAEVSASAVADTTSTKKLVLISKTTGSSQAISLANTTGTLLDQLGLTAAVISGRTQSTTTTAGYAYSNVATLNSKFTLDGIDLEKETNSVTDALAGVTIDLKGTHAVTDPALSLTVSVDKTALKDKVTKFITDYNDAIKYLNLKTSVDPATKTRQVLAGDSVFTGLRYDLRTIVASSVSSVQSGNPSILSSIGISVNRDGTLTFKDTEKFNEMLSAGPEKISDLFNSTNGIAATMKTKLDAMLSSSTGQMDTASKTTSDQITNLTDRITRFDARLDKQVERYRNEFLKLQAAYAQVAQQQQTIASITSYYG